MSRHHRPLLQPTIWILVTVAASLVSCASDNNCNARQATACSTPYYECLESALSVDRVCGCIDELGVCVTAAGCRDVAQMVEFVDSQCIPAGCSLCSDDQPDGGRWAMWLSLGMFLAALLCFVVFLVVLIVFRKRTNNKCIASESLLFVAGVTLFVVSVAFAAGPTDSLEFYTLLQGSPFSARIDELTSSTASVLSSTSNIVYHYIPTELAINDQLTTLSSTYTFETSSSMVPECFGYYLINGSYFQVDSSVNSTSDFCILEGESSYSDTMSKGNCDNDALYSFPEVTSVNISQQVVTTDSYYFCWSGMANGTSGTVNFDLDVVTYNTTAAVQTCESQSCNYTVEDDVYYVVMEITNENTDMATCRIYIFGDHSKFYTIIIVLVVLMLAIGVVLSLLIPFIRFCWTYNPLGSKSKKKKTNEELTLLQEESYKTSKTKH